MSTADTTIFTVPSGETWVVKGVAVVNVTATTRYLNFYVGAAAAATAFRNRWPVFGNNYVQESGLYWAFAAGEELHSIAEAVNALRVTVWGYKLLD